MEKVNEQRYSTASLIRELDTESPNFKLVCLVVGFDNHSEFVFGNDRLKVTKLNAYVESGGEPVGLIGFDWERGVVRVYTRPLAQFDDQVWAESFLDRAVTAAYRAVKTSGRVKPKSRIERKSGWAEWTNRRVKKR